MEETDALGAIAGLGVAVLATLHFHVDTNKPNIGRIQQALVKSILSHRTLNGLAGGLVYATLGDTVAHQRGGKKFCLFKICHASLQMVFLTAGHESYDLARHV